MELDRVPSTLSAQEFVNRWRSTQLKGRPVPQSFFNDFCRVLGWPSATDVNPIGDWCRFEVAP
jgi:hypothetical protein